jgi:hypothetical protein
MEKRNFIFAKNLKEIKLNADEVSIIKFDDKLVRVVTQQTDIQKILNEAKFSGQPGGSTSLYAGASEGVKTIEKSIKPKVLILLTDGRENSSFSFWKTPATTAQEFIKQARAINIRVFPVSFGNGTNTALLSELAMLGDGKYDEIEDETQITDIYKELPYLFKYYYKVTYKPIQKPGERVTKLDYFNLQEIKNTKGTTFIGDGFNLDTYEGYKSNAGIGVNTNTGSSIVPRSSDNLHKTPRVIQLDYNTDVKDVLGKKASNKVVVEKQPVAPP